MEIGFIVIGLCLICWLRSELHSGRFSRVFRQVVLHPRTQMIKTTLKSIDIKLENQMSASIKLNYPFLCFSCCSWIRFVTLKMRFVLFTDIKCYVPITHFVPQGLERIYAPSLHLAFMSEHNAASGDLWHAEKKAKGQFTQISFLTSFVPFSVEEIVPHELLSAHYVEYPEHKGHCLWKLLCVFHIKKEHRVLFISIVLGCFWFWNFKWKYFGELTFYVNLSMTLSWIRESKCSTISCIY